MDRQEASRRDEALADAVRVACLEAARHAFEDAALRGLCCEGAFECALGALETLDVQAVIRQFSAGNPEDAS